MTPTLNPVDDLPSYEVVSETLGFYDDHYSKARDALGDALATATPYQSQLLPLFDALNRAVVELVRAYADMAISTTVADDGRSDYFASTVESLTEILDGWTSEAKP